MKISWETIEEVYKTANVYDVISDYLSLKKSGANYLTLCPFHTEKTPSFVVSPTKNIWKCFGCGKGGDSIKFLMEYKGLSFSEAIVELANKYGIKIKYVGNTEKDLEKEKLYSVIDKVAKFYMENLKKSKEAKEYLKERKVNSSTIEKFLIGYSPLDIKPLLTFIEKNNISLEDLKKIGVLTQSITGDIKDRFRGRIIFPIRNNLGKIVAFGGRILPSNKNLPKYINSPETEIYNKSKVLYGFFESKEYLLEKKEVIVVEGYFDVISLHQVGVRNVVGTLGTSLTEEHAKLLKKFINKAILMFDNDRAGKEAVLRATKILLSYDIEVYYSPLEQKDPDELAKYGVKEVKNQLSKSKEIFQFLLENIKKKNEIKERQKLTKIYLELASYIPDKTKIGFLIDRLSKEIGIRKEYLEVNYKKIKERSLKNNDKNKDLGLSYNEIIVLKTLLEKPDEVLTSFKNFDKIKCSRKFKILLNKLLEGETEEDIFQDILSYDAPSNPKFALEILNKMYKNWEKENLELSINFSYINDEAKFLENLEKLIKEKQQIK